MIIITQPTATEEQIERIVARIAANSVSSRKSVAATRASSLA